MGCYAYSKNNELWDYILLKTTGILLTCATSGAGTADPSGAPDFILGF
jgi:hypothetical protein